jgi:hypothetical protein
MLPGISAASIPRQPPRAAGGRDWNGERMVQLRKALVEKRPEDISICKACDVPGTGRRAHP